MNVVYSTRCTFLKILDYYYKTVLQIIVYSTGCTFLKYSINKKTSTYGIALNYSSEAVTCWHRDNKRWRKFIASTRHLHWHFNMIRSSWYWKLFIHKTALQFNKVKTINTNVRHWNDLNDQWPLYWNLSYSTCNLRVFVVMQGILLICCEWLTVRVKVLCPTMCGLCGLTVEHLFAIQKVAGLNLSRSASR